MAGNVDLVLLQLQAGTQDHVPCVLLQQSVRQRYHRRSYQAYRLISVRLPRLGTYRSEQIPRDHVQSLPLVLQRTDLQESHLHYVFSLPLYNPIILVYRYKYLTHFQQQRLQ